MTTTIVKRYPTFQIHLITEDSEHLLTYDTKKQKTQRDFEESLIAFSTRNAMEDDSPVFSLVISAKEEWDKILGANDLIRIKVIPDTRKGEPDNPYVMVGLISDIHKEGEYEDGILLYRITGRSMAKALIDFEVGVIQEVSTVITDIGWLPDGTDKGLKFSGNSAAGIGSELMERFVYKYLEYNFSRNRKLKDFLEYDFSSWEEDEALGDVTPFINYEGNLRQFLEDVTAKPFNEIFFEYTKDGKCIVIMRPTPFDPDKWRELPTYHFTSDIVAEDSIGVSDTEQFAIFVVQPPNVMEFNSMDLGVFPKHHPELIKKYGYKRLDAQNRYLLTPHLISGGDEEEVGTNTSNPEGVQVNNINAPAYEDVLQFITNNGYENRETLRTRRNEVFSHLLENFPSMSNSLANNIIDSIIEGFFNREEYSKMVNSTGDDVRDREINEERSIAGEKLEKFTNRLFNWYCENANFYAGDLRVIGNPTYRVGSRLIYEDLKNKTVWEYYLESVQHEFSFDGGYTTILGVTRGLPDRGRKRFSNLWGKSEDFKGGYLGEHSLEELLEKAREAESIRDGQFGGGGISFGDGPGGNIAMATLNTARQMTQRNSVYVFGGGRKQTNPLNDSIIRVDCSSFVWWCYYMHGIQLKGGKTGMTTDTIKTDSRLKIISRRGGSKSIARSLLREGDLVYFDTYKTDGHIGIYSGNGKYIGAQSSTGIAEADMNSGYWWSKFNGHVLRYKG
ncbi:tail protein with lysin activity [Bacillus phage Shbh1]|uniref:Tail lysin-like protein n=1 Tax=Bacillus phage Shbh1 TaxID=1796992 RepID=A0A142F1E9_9CAUD|nr:tail protein with lysin activity [Bacillus phage Shbh1]AMQ66606.1 tail lysin-like protein [Bacillus phage Shbh1]